MGGTSKYFALDGKLTQEIPANANLDNYQTPGPFACSTNITAETIENCPVSEAFTMNCYYGTGWAYLTQEITTYYKHKRFIRTLDNGWKPWHEYPTTNNPAFTGNMTINKKTPESFKTHYAGVQTNVGYLLKINKSTTDRMIDIHMWGNSYEYGMPIDTYIQAYNYAGAGKFLSCSQINNGCNISPVKFFYLDGFAFAWVPMIGAAATAHFSVSSNDISNYSMDFDLSYVPMPTDGVTALVTCDTQNRVTSKTYPLQLLNGWHPYSDAFKPTYNKTGSQICVNLGLIRNPVDQVAWGSIIAKLPNPETSTVVAFSAGGVVKTAQLNEYGNFVNVDFIAANVDIGITFNYVIKDG